MKTAFHVTLFERFSPVYFDFRNGCGICNRDEGEDIAHGLGKILYAFMFSWGLVMILYMNAELGTSNMLYMTVGVFGRDLL